MKLEVERVILLVYSCRMANRGLSLTFRRCVCCRSVKFAADQCEQCIRDADYKLLVMFWDSVLLLFVNVFFFFCFFKS